MKQMEETEQLKRLNKILPPLAFLLSGATFVIILMAGHSGSKALLVAGLMLVFILLTWGLRVWFGPKGFILAMGILGLLGWRLQAAGVL